MLNGYQTFSNELNIMLKNPLWESMLIPYKYLCGFFMGVIVMTEIWKDIAGYEGYYQISNFGRVKSLQTKAYSHAKKCAVVVLREKILKPYPNTDKYLLVDLNKDGKRNCQKVHRLVAKAFIPNENDYPQVNHKDENKQNNCVENLEWCTCQYNTTYGTAKLRMAQKQMKKVIQISETGEIIRKWNSIKEAAEDLSVTRDTITLWCLHGVRPRKYKNYIFKSVKE